MKPCAKLLKCAIYTTILLNCGVAWADIVPDSPDMFFMVNSVDYNGLIVSSAGEKFRIFGIVPNADFSKYATENLVGKELKCDDAGFTGTKTMFLIEDPVRAIDCPPTGTDIGRHSGSIQEELIRAGVALEYCAESRNYFKTCRTEEK
jgi:hypothetical protein